MSNIRVDNSPFDRWIHLKGFKVGFKVNIVSFPTLTVRIDDLSNIQM